MLVRLNSNLKEKHKAATSRGTYMEKDKLKREIVQGRKKKAYRHSCGLYTLLVATASATVKIIVVFPNTTMPLEVV